MSIESPPCVHRPETMQQAVGRHAASQRCGPDLGGQLAQPEPAAHARKEQPTGRSTLLGPLVLTLSCAAAAGASRTRRARPQARRGARRHPGCAAGKLTCGILSGRVRRAGDLVVVDQPPLVIQSKVSVVVDPWSAHELGFRTRKLQAATCSCYIRERCDSLTAVKAPGLERGPGWHSRVVIDPDPRDPADLPAGTVEACPAYPCVGLFNRRHVIVRIPLSPDGAHWDAPGRSCAPVMRHGGSGLDDSKVMSMSS